MMEIYFLINLIDMKCRNFQQMYTSKRPMYLVNTRFNIVLDLYTGGHKNKDFVGVQPISACVQHVA